MEGNMENVFEILNEKGLLEYGATFSADYFRELCGIVEPKTGTKKEFDMASLAELSAIDFIRNVLIQNGRYIKKDGDNYRVLLPSENAKQADLMRESARKKLNKAKKLETNTPKDAIIKHQTSTQSMINHVSRTSRLSALLN
jgi:hypothetical protein